MWIVVEEFEILVAKIEQREDYGVEMHGG